MTYEIRTYSEEYLEKQVEIGSSILKNWLGAAQTPYDRLKAAYSKEGFDPSSKYYAFKDGEMVARLTGAKPKNQILAQIAEHLDATPA